MNNIPQPFSKVSDFSKIVADLKKDEISKVLSDEEGYFFIKVGSRKSSYIPELKDIEQEVAKRYTEMEARNRCRKAADATLGRLKKGESLVKIAQENKLAPAESGFF